MSERKVLQKYYPPEFDPSEITRRKGPKATGPKIQTVRLMAPFSMKCLSCGEYIYKGRKFNSRKETRLGEKYLGIQIFFFHIKCTRCSAEITFRTDPKNTDYAMVKGAMRSIEPWRNPELAEETMEQRLDRLEREEAEAAGDEDRNAMEDLEAKNADARREMAAADALDEIRQRNARIHRSEKEGTDYSDLIAYAGDEEREREEREFEEAASRAFALAKRQHGGALQLEDAPGDAALAADGPAPISTTKTTTSTATTTTSVRAEATTATATATAMTLATGEAAPYGGLLGDGPEADRAAMPPPSFKRVVKKKKDHAALLGIKKKPSLV